MPELPEVETTLRGIEPFVAGKKILSVRVRNASLRWPVSPELIALPAGTRICSLQRRAKYLLFETAKGTFLMHLGMSGSLRICNKDEALQKHDHIIFSLARNRELRFNDPRRFGCALWAGEDPLLHPLLSELGFEPLGDEASSETLFIKSRRKKVPIKNFIMDNKVIVGVGNIYASEALFLSGIRPGRAAGRITRKEFTRLLENIQHVLTASIELGGSTLRDFVGGDGKPGYFQQTLNVYGRAGEACSSCGASIRKKTIGQRSSFYCSSCQS